MRTPRKLASSPIIERYEDDFGLFASVKDGDVHAFELLFHKYHPLLVQFAEHYVKSDCIADEIVVDVFYSIWNRRDSIEINSGSIADYLYVAVRNRALNVVKTNVRRDGLIEGANRGDDIPGMGTVDVDILQRLYAEDISRELEKAVSLLPEKARAILTLRWQQKMSTEQIARVTGMTVGAVQMQVSRGIKILKSLLEADTR